MKRLIVSLLVAHLLAYAGLASAYDNKTTHRDLSAATVEASVLKTDQTVLSNLGLEPLSAKQQFPNSEGLKETISELIQDGSEFEDKGRRPLNHFYDPVYRRPLTHAVCITSPCNTSPNWALEDRGDIDGQDFSFKDAREAFHLALTSQDAAERERKFGKTFQALGQIIHHLQDMAQPQHTRNDPHPDLFGDTIDVRGLENPSVYERYTRDLATLPFAPYDRVTFDIARSFWHTDFDGQGIADYSNRGFVSAGTNFYSKRTPRYPDPDVTLGFGTEEDMTTFCDKYHVPRPQGPDGNPLPCLMTFIHTLVEDHYQSSQSRENPRTSTYSIYSEDLTTYGDTKDYTLNRFNFDKALEFLIPRAVAYSAGLIDYFFRGKLEITSPERYLYGLTTYKDNNTGKFTKLRFKVKNTSDEDTSGPGQMWAVVRYRTSQNKKDLFVTPNDDLSEPQYAISNPVSVTLSRDPQEVTFDFDDDSKNSIPTNSADLFLTVVYKGKLGEEDEAILAGGKDLFEPQPMDFGNVTDYDCYNNELHYVADLPPGDPGRGNLVGPQVERGQFRKDSDLSKPLVEPSEENFDFAVTETPWAHYSRYVLLQDSPSFVISELAGEVEDVGTGDVSQNEWRAWEITALENSIKVDETGNTTRRYTSNLHYRGLTTFLMFLRLPRIEYPCIFDTYNLDPPLSRVDGELPTQ